MVKEKAFGPCRMCLIPKDLVRSHLMPAFLYDYCRQGEHKPIKVGGGVLIPTDRQTQAYLLCEECEDILNKGGEMWIAGKLATWERSFPLYDLLMKGPPEFDEKDMAVYFAAKNSEIDVEKLTHFALGMFWKASVHSWSGSKTAASIELGLYSEKIRTWLRSKSWFPEDMYLIVVVSRPLRAQIVLNEPYEARREGWQNFFVYVPGVLFMLNVGKTVDESMRWLCVYQNPGHPINIAEELTDRHEGLMVKSVLGSRKTKAYLKARAKADEERLRPKS
jgi:hypothetical protein